MNDRHYRILRADGLLMLYSVRYGEDGKPRSRGARPATFGAWQTEGPENLIASLEQALKEAREPIIDLADLPLEDEFADESYIPVAQSPDGDDDIPF